ncbi:hypothetical protein K440DRAFT_646008 [Wilcoxina mikolae CBS 423.85]|nr:hypothetical protein K440DRAFT_646008 [Wilcoxina mikolae CBS 423.85]
MHPLRYIFLFPVFMFLLAVSHASPIEPSVSFLTEEQALAEGFEPIPSAFFTGAGGENATSARARISYKCETSGGSPSFNGLLGAAIKLTQRPADKFCEQLNPAGSFCKKLVTSGDAAISICVRCPRKYGNTWRVGGLMNLYDWEGPGDNFKIVFHRS